MLREHVTEIRPALPFLLCLFLEPFEFLDPTSHLQVRRTLAAIAGLVGEREVVFGIEAVFRQGVDVIDVELPFSATTRSNASSQMKHLPDCREASRCSNFARSSGVRPLRYFDGIFGSYSW